MESTSLTVRVLTLTADSLANTLSSLKLHLESAARTDSPIVSSPIEGPTNNEIACNTTNVERFLLGIHQWLALNPAAGVKVVDPGGRVLLEKSARAPVLTIDPHPKHAFSEHIHSEHIPNSGFTLERKSPERDLGKSGHIPDTDFHKEIT